MYNRDKSGDGDKYSSNSWNSSNTSKLNSGDKYEYNPNSTKYEEEEVSKPFVWGKKVERDKQLGRESQIENMDAYIDSQREELIQVRLAREKRMKEQEEMRKLRENMRRDQDIEANTEFAQHEQAFHRTQAWKKSEIRQNEGRRNVLDHYMFPLFVKMKLVDVTKLKAFGQSLGESAQVLKAREDFIEFLDTDLIDLTVFSQNLSLEDLDELSNEVEGMKQFAMNARDKDYQSEVAYWDCLYVCILRWKDILVVRQKFPHTSFQEAEKIVATGTREEYITGNYLSKSVVNNIHALLANESLAKLIQQEKEVSGKVAEEEHKQLLPKGVEIYGLVNSYAPFELSCKVQSYENQGFWRSVHNEQILFGCRAQLRAFVFRQMKMRIYYFEKVRRDEEEKALKQYQLSQVGSTVARTYIGSKDVVPVLECTHVQHAVDMSLAQVNERIKILREAVLLSAGDMDVDGQLEAVREQGVVESEDMLHKVVEAGLEEGDEDGIDADMEAMDLGTVTYSWTDKHRPRKPRFVNKVRTGFAWHKYNRAHYDKDNPPPRVVQGYKFNIFYPDLIDHRVAPRFSISPDPQGDIDFCVLRFIAGAPYEDVAFRIVNKKWGIERKKGYKCTFNQGVLSLWFNFQRIGYRR